MNRGAALQRQRLFSCVSHEHVETGSRQAVLAAVRVGALQMRKFFASSSRVKQGFSHKL